MPIAIDPIEEPVDAVLVASLDTRIVAATAELDKVPPEDEKHKPIAMRVDNLDAIKIMATVKDWEATYLPKGVSCGLDEYPRLKAAGVVA